MTTLQSGARLAVDGGRPVRRGPMSPWPAFGPDDLAAAEAVLRSGKVNYWTGSEGRRFEEEFAAFAGCRHAIALANGTVALELALYALGVGPGDEVVVPSRTFIASASSIAARGAVPVVADVDPDSQNLTPETVEAVLTPRTRAIVAVHLAGWPCEMDALMALAERRGLKVVEDCAQAHGARYRGRPVGSWGHAAAFSFCQDKIMTTGGEGGMLTTDDTELWRRAWRYKDHGKSPDILAHAGGPQGYRWVHEVFGTNMRLSEIQAALGRAALAKLPDWLAARRRNAERLAEAWADLPALRQPRPGAGIAHAHYKHYAFVRPEALKPGWDRDRVMAAVHAEGVPCFVGSCSEIYRERAFDAAPRPAERLGAARLLGETALMFQIHPTLTGREIDETAEAVRKVLSAATRR